MDDESRKTVKGFIDKVRAEDDAADTTWASRIKAEAEQRGLGLDFADQFSLITGYPYARELWIGTTVKDESSSKERLAKIRKDLRSVIKQVRPETTVGFLVRIPRTGAPKATKTYVFPVRKRA